MLAAYAAAQDPDLPLDGPAGGEPDPGAPPDGFVDVELRAAALNRHDLWSLRGYGLPADRLPMVLGTDAAAITADGREAIVHAVGRDVHGASLLSERHPGTLAESIAVPEANLVPKPAELSFEEAACLPAAYNMLFGKARMLPGEHVLIHGAGGGVATAAVLLAVAAGLDARRMATTGTKPLVDSVWPLTRAREALQRMADGDAFGKPVVRPPR